MTIPESQLQTWAMTGSRALSQSTYQSIQNALSSSQYSIILGKDYEVYLQGSYKNSTNIRGDSDVDVVVHLNSTFQSNALSLSPQEWQLYYQSFPNASYSWEDFKRDTHQSLNNYFGSSSVTLGNKSIKIAPNSSRLPADVIPAIQYRSYSRFSSSGEPYVEGILLFDRNGNKIINFPKVHYQNGVSKNQNTKEWYKPVVRIFKNARCRLVDSNVIADNLAPSYFIECLLYNVPNHKFDVSYSTSVYNVLEFLQNANLSGFRCQNGQTDLFGQSQQQWNIGSANSFITAMINLWNNW